MEIVLCRCLCGTGESSTSVNLTKLAAEKVGLKADMREARATYMVQSTSCDTQHGQVANYRGVLQRATICTAIVKAV